MANNGKLIVFEGIDGSGKTTVMDKIYDWMKDTNLPVVKTREPGGCIAGEYIRDTLLSDDYDISPLTELLLFEAARHEHTINVLKPNLKAGNIVLCDRFTDSTLAYQGLKLPKDTIEYLNNEATCNIKPDMVILLKCDVAEALYRMEKDDTRKTNKMDKLSFSDYSKIQNTYIALANTRNNYCIVDANDNIDIVMKVVRNIIINNVINPNGAIIDTKMKMISADTARKFSKEGRANELENLMEEVKERIIKEAKAGNKSVCVELHNTFKENKNSIVNLLKSYGYEASISGATLKISWED